MQAWPYSLKHSLFRLVYSTLYQLNLDGTYSLDLADSVDVSSDGTVWTFKIRENAKFHDGAPITAKDVAFSLNLYKDTEGFPFLHGYTDHFAAIEAPDDATVVITLDDAIPNMESQLFSLYILPEHLWGEKTAQAAIDFTNDTMVGSGPFKLAEYRQNQFVRLDTNQDYYGSVPKVDGAILQTYGNQDALVQALKTGEVDMITEMPNTAVAALRNDANIQLVVGAPLDPGVTDIIFNLVPPDQCPPDGKCTGHPALKDLTVRKALAHATDKQQLIDIVLLGLGTPGLTLIPDGLGVYYNNTLQDYAFDIATANKLLDDAGYKDVNGDGVRETPDGKAPLSFRLNWAGDMSSGPRIAELLSKTWGEIGIKVEMQGLDPDTLTSVCCPAFDYDIIIWGWGSDPDPAFLLSVMTTDEIPTGTSESGYSNPEYDELFAQQAVETDKEKRKELIWEMQAIALRDLPYIIPYYGQNVQAFRKDRFQGWITDSSKIALEDPSSLSLIEPVK
ncbi:MAG: ABC transporter substrate-binding protein [Anaerolineales bacterium]|nr:ABC transporter substrate-binding protein [Anaerolineales bacterium]